MTGHDRINAERDRQKTVEGWTPDVRPLRDRLAAARKPECRDCGRVVERGTERCPHCGNVP